MHAVANGHEKLVKWLIAKGADINPVDKIGNSRTPLHLAAMKSNNADVVKILIENGANINACDHEKCIPLHLAA